MLFHRNIIYSCCALFRRHNYDAAFEGTPTSYPKIRATTEGEGHPFRVVYIYIKVSNVEKFDSYHQVR